MGGVYVAKPEPLRDMPDVPPGWIQGYPDYDWEVPGTWPPPNVPIPPFPGPEPPGYKPEYSLLLTSTTAVCADGALGYALVTLRDHVKYATERPKDSVIRWTAKIDGQVVLMRFGSTGGHATSLTSQYSQIGDFWGNATTDLQFKLTESDIGKTITLKATSNVSGELLTAEVNIEVTSDVVISGEAGTYWAYGFPVRRGIEVRVTAYRYDFGLEDPAPVETTADENGYYSLKLMRDWIDEDSNERILLVATRDGRERRTTQTLIENGTYKINLSIDPALELTIDLAVVSLTYYNYCKWRIRPGPEYWRPETGIVYSSGEYSHLVQYGDATIISNNRMLVRFTNTSDAYIPTYTYIAMHCSSTAGMRASATFSMKIEGSLLDSGIFGGVYHFTESQRRHWLTVHKYADSIEVEVHNTY